MPKWEYKIVSPIQLHMAGLEGWEAYAVDYRIVPTYFMKREISDR